MLYSKREYLLTNKKIYRALINTAMALVFMYFSYTANLFALIYVGAGIRFHYFTPLRINDLFLKLFFIIALVSMISLIFLSFKNYKKLKVCALSAVAVSIISILITGYIFMFERCEGNILITADWGTYIYLLLIIVLFVVNTGKTIFAEKR